MGKAREKRLIAINLPQFHPFKENDEWWGKGFTEWTNVTNARPRFRGHYQPHLPTDTGFYDLRLPESRQMQADMAKEYGIYGFCYYHYWFNGHRLMEQPLNDMLRSGEPDFPFMLCWANENWARNWAGGFKDILIEQNYNKEDDIEHIRYLCMHYFSDKRYIRIDNRPVFAIYRPLKFPDINDTIKSWRVIAKQEFNLELYLIRVESPSDFGERKDLCFDASMDFQPIVLRGFGKRKNVFSKLNKIIFKNRLNFTSDIFLYKDYVNFQLSLPKPKYKIYPCVSPGWDNSPRRVGKPFMAFKGASPSLYKKWLLHTLRLFVPYSNEENFVFINAWNEWAEGNHLEPDIKWGRGFLEATKEAIIESK